MHFGAYDVMTASRIAIVLHCAHVDALSISWVSYFIDYGRMQLQLH